MLRIILFLNFPPQSPHILNIFLQSWNFNLKFRKLVPFIICQMSFTSMSVQFCNHRWIKIFPPAIFSDLIWNQIFYPSFRPSFTQCDLLRILKRCWVGKFWRLGRKFSWLKSFPFSYKFIEHILTGLTLLLLSIKHLNCMHMFVCMWISFGNDDEKLFHVHSEKNEWRQERGIEGRRFKESFLLLPFVPSINWHIQ